MADLRIRVAKDKAKLVKSLRAGEGSTGLFQTYYEALVFAAALGINKSKMIPIKEGEYSKEIDPIRQEQFASKGYDQIINFVAVAYTKDPRILANTEETEARRIAIFEGFANGGLQIIQSILQGSEDSAKQLFLLLIIERNFSKASEEPFDLSFL